MKNIALLSITLLVLACGRGPDRELDSYEDDQKEDVSTQAISEELLTKGPCSKEPSLNDEAHILVEFLPQGTYTYVGGDVLMSEKYPNNKNVIQLHVRDEQIKKEVATLSPVCSSGLEWFSDSQNRTEEIPKEFTSDGKGALSLATKRRFLLSFFTPVMGDAKFTSVDSAAFDRQVEPANYVEPLSSSETTTNDQNWERSKKTLIYKSKQDPHQNTFVVVAHNVRTNFYGLKILVVTKATYKQN